MFKHPNYYKELEKIRKKFEASLDPEEVPANLVIRLSRSKIDLEAAPNAWSHDSGVTTQEGKRTCPAPDQDGKCGDCRQCWNKDIKSVIYGKH